MKQLNDAYQQVCRFLERFGADAFGNVGGAAPADSGMGADQQFRRAAAPPPEREPPMPPTVSFAKAGDAFAG